MKKGVFILAGVLAIGGVAYLYFSNKKKQEAILGGTKTSEATNLSSNPSSAELNSIDKEITPIKSGSIVTSETKETTIQAQENLDKANDIADKIREKYKLSAIYQAKVNPYKPSSMIFSFVKPINRHQSQISNLKDDLLKLGYEFKGEKDGVLVKI